MVRKSIWMAVAAAVCAMFMAAPSGAQYPGPITLEIDDPTVSAGQVVNLSGSCSPGETVIFTLNGEVLGQTTSEGERAGRALGDYSAQVTIPAGLAPGTYEIIATCGGETASVTITVLGDGVTPPGGTTPGGGGTLSRTGSDLTTPIAIGVGLLALGAVVLALAGNRRGRTA